MNERSTAMSAGVGIPRAPIEAASIDARARSRTLDALETGTYDVLVIGGGITGAGIARDAARRGLSVALVEAEDFAAGTSSRSSKLIHGGLRYLAMGEVWLVRETARERKVVHRLAPHLAEPRWMVLPVGSWLALAKYRFGITAYEKLGAVAPVDRHQNWNADALATHEPALDTDRYPWACAYREYLTDDARLVLAALRDARAGGAVVANRVRVAALLRGARERIDGARVEARPEGRTLEVRARVTVNAAGPWAEELARLESPEAQARLHRSKGVHIVLPHARLPVRHPLMLQAADGRPIFVIPRGETVYVGTTDTTYRGRNWLWPEIERDEVRYLLEPVRRYFRVEPIEPEECVAAWAGLRPLIAEPGKAAKELSRRDEIWVGANGLVTIAGGKLTGFRTMADDVLATVGEALGVALPEGDASTPLPGGDFDGDLDTLAHTLNPNLGDRLRQRLVRLYGSEAQAVVARGEAPLVPGGEVLAGEVDWAVGHEGAMTLEDVIYRRTRAAWYSPGERDALLAPIADRLAGLLGWSDAERGGQIDEVRARIGWELAFRGASGDA